MIARTGDGARYGEARALFVEALDSVHSAARVPACPAWSVVDLLAHQVHQLAGAGDGTFPVLDALAALVAPTADERRAASARQQDWIARGVQRWRRRPVPSLVEEWAALADDAPEIALAGLLPDLAVHLFDLLGAAGNRSHRDHPLVVDALRFWLGQADARVRLAGPGGLRLVIDHGPSIGEPDAELTVSGSGFELLRTITGRRSRSQRALLRWTPDTTGAVEPVALYGWRDIPLDE